ncbi:unnamed protein product [Agarophyton chilense]|eukprot:gb/GEZJ01001986.1/.p2 GENE.gb/GEZJ01001986.1/~~gb/GEZJ01001986.1/.p2  ORF type:complete len:318 (-),score=42.30 gb/GEZJ01001986.1/:1244-2197(-)
MTKFFRGDSVLHAIIEADGTIDVRVAFERPQLEAFVRRAKAAGFLIAVVSSGGTSVPLEKRAVRYLDNFSSGTRGAKSAENFLQNHRNGNQKRLGMEGSVYAVIFLYREGSKLPFLRKLSPEQIANASQISESEVKFRDEAMVTALKSWKDTKNRLFLISYQTVQEYLLNLFTIAETLRPLRKSVLFFLAAAVSDFYIPSDQLSEHKIQSQGEDLELTLKPVPKCLGLLRQQWAPEAFIASFKLETDPEILEEKSKVALEQYGVHCVIGNLLQSRYQEVVIFDTVGKRVLKRKSAEECIEVSLVKEVAMSHERFFGE